jgi:hypothetical protein
MDVPSPAPSASAVAGATPTSAAVVAPAPTPAPTLVPLTYFVTPAPPAAGAPAISQIALSDRVVHAGAPYLVLVMTSPDVSAVTAEAFGVRFALFPAGPGRFGVTGITPSIPWMIANRTATVRFVATTPDGRATAASIDLRVAH